MGLEVHREEQGVQSSRWELSFKGPESREGQLLKAVWGMESQTDELLRLSRSNQESKPWKVEKRHQFSRHRVVMPKAANSGSVSRRNRSGVRPCQEEERGSEMMAVSALGHAHLA